MNRSTQLVNRNARAYDEGRIAVETVVWRGRTNSAMTAPEFTAIALPANRYSLARDAPAPGCRAMRSSRPTSSRPLKLKLKSSIVCRSPLMHGGRRVQVYLGSRTLDAAKGLVARNASASIRIAFVRTTSWHEGNLQSG